MLARTVLPRASDAVARTMKYPACVTGRSHWDVPVLVAASHEEITVSCGFDDFVGLPSGCSPVTPFQRRSTSSTFTFTLGRRAPFGRAVATSVFSAVPAAT